jgi:aspartyl-tRNA(Asn)/glutamyl-tRNA(Gln) amidotransferase subunit B
MQNKYDIIIGLEVHVHLKTESKLFCRCKNEFGGDPNTHVCPVCTGQPGVLPVLNKKAIEQAIRSGLALGCAINNKSIFARKQYFYPDLPKNYQITQYELPIAEHGSLEIEGKRIGVTRAHMEEDAGKLIHTEGNVSLVDYNRTGAPLLEIVSEPEITSPEEAGEYLKNIRQVLRYSGISDCDMEKGSLRCDANISLKEAGAEQFGIRAEIKNLNSFKAVVKALEYEVKRQEKLLNNGEAVVQETRLWDDNKGITRSMRSKEEAHDYRYFPEPDLPPLMVDDGWVEEIKETLPEMPAVRLKRYMDDYQLSDYDAGVLIQDKEIADYFEVAASALKQTDQNIIKKITNWITVELLAKVNSTGIEFLDQPVKAEYIAELVQLIEKGTISGKMAKEIFDIMWDSGKAPGEIVEEKGLKQISSGDQIEEICKKAITENPDIVQKFLSGKEGVIGALVGSVMKETRGQANPKLVNDKLRALLQEQKA